MEGQSKVQPQCIPNAAMHRHGIVLSHVGRITFESGGSRSNEVDDGHKHSLPPTTMAPHGSTKEEGTQEPPPMTPAGQYTVQVSSPPSMSPAPVPATHAAHRPSQ